MDNSGEMLQLCRLCLVKDDVNIPIFEEQGDIRKIFLKISSCLPVKVSRDDKLPKKICDGCSYKLDMLYEFWNTTANAEKQLLSWLGEAGMNSKMTDDTMTAVAQQIKPAETFVKQEAIDPSDIHTEENDDDKTYMFQQKFTIEEGAGPSATVTSNTSNEEEEPPPKRARRTAAVKAQIAMDPESDDDEDSGEPLTKVEDESEDSDGEDHEPAFVDVPSTSADDQPGPSGVGKDGVEAPFFKVIFNGSEENFECLRCHKIFVTLHKLKRHSQYHKEKKFVCDICGCKFVYKYEISLHKNMVHCKDNKYECDLCNKTFPNLKYLKAHFEKVHTIDRKYVCGRCGKRYYNKAFLKLHELKDHEGVRFTCEYCKKQFKSRYYYRDHMKIHDPDFKKPSYPCSMCLKVYDHRQSLKNHQKYHEGQVPKMLCQVCGKVVCSNSSLQDHMRIHLGEKPFKCDKCEKCFTSSNLLRTHYRIHTKETPFTCEICNKSFSQKTTLNVHMRYHTGERPYSCLACSKKFVTKTVLKNHRCK